MRSAGLEKQPAYLVLQHVFSRVILNTIRKKVGAVVIYLEISVLVWLWKLSNVELG